MNNMNNYQAVVLEILKSKLESIKHDITKCNLNMQLDYVASFEKDIPTQLYVCHKVKIWLECLVGYNFSSDLSNNGVSVEVAIQIKWAIESLFKLKIGLDTWVVREKMEVLREIAHAMKDDYKFPIGDFSEYYGNF